MADKTIPVLKVLRGNVGIGSATPTSNLEVIASGADLENMLRVTLGTAGRGVYIGAPQTATVAGVIDFRNGNVATRYLDFRGEGTSRMVIQTDGNVGIGTTAPAVKLDVAGTIQGQKFQFNDDTNTSIDTFAADQIGFKLGANNSVKWAFVAGAYGMQFMYGSGTASYPSYTWNGDSDTGMFNATTNALGFTTGGTERMRLTSDGAVGIGTVSPNPNYKLHIYSTSTSTGAGLRVQGSVTYADGAEFAKLQLMNSVTSTTASMVALYDGANNNTALAFKTDISAGTNERMRIQSDGKVGIGTAAPDTKLHVEGQGTFKNNGANLILKNTWSSGNQDILFAGGSVSTGGANNTAARIRSLATAPSGAATGDLLFTVNSGDSFVDALYIQEDGKVGIGTTAPTTTLNIKGAGYDNNTVGSADFLLEATGTVGPTATFKNASGDYGSLYFGDSASWIGQNAFGFVIHDAGSAADVKMVIKSDGKVGIGTTAPTADLHVYEGSSGGTVSSNSNIIAIESNTNNGLQFLNPSANNANINFGDNNANEIGFIQYQHAQDRMNFRAGGTTIMSLVGGNIGIGTASPSELLEVKGSAHARILVDAANAALLTLDRGATDEGAKVYFKTAGTTNWMVGTQDSDDWGDGTPFFIGTVETAAGARLVIKTDGNVGIGTTTPASRLNIYGGVGSFATGLTFGDGDTGFYEDSDDSLWYFSGGVKRWKSDSGYLFSTITTSKATIVNEVATATNPVYTFYNDLDTGLGQVAANQLSLIAGGVKAAVVTSTGFGIGAVPSASAILDMRDSGDVNTQVILINTGQTTAGRETEFLFGKDNGANLSATLKYYYHTTQSLRRIDLFHYGTTNGLSIFDGGDVEVTAGTLKPQGNNTQSLGNNARRWNFYANTGDFGGSIYARAGIKDDGGDFGTSGQVLTTNGVDQVNWIDSPGAGSVSGSGTDNYVPRWNGTTALQNSALFSDDNGKVGIGQENPTSPLSISCATAFDLVAGTSTGQDNILLQNNTNGVGNGNYGPSIGFGNAEVGSAYKRRYAAIVSVQTTADGDQVGLAFVTHPGSGSTDALEEKMRIEHDGKVGIGTTAPTAPLTLSGANKAYLDWNETTTSTTFRWVVRSDNGNFQVQNVGGGTQPFVIQKADGNVGIGTDAPGAELEVYRHSTNYFQIKNESLLRANTSGVGFRVYNSDAAGTAFRVGSSNATPSLSIYGSNGSVGIGTATPSSLLELYSSAPELTIKDGGTWGTNATAYINLKDSSSSMAYIGVTGTGGDLDIKQIKAGAVRIFTNNTEKVRVLSDGKVGIGTASPDTKLHISTTDGTSIIRLERNDSTITAGDSYGQLQWEGQDAGSGAGGVRASIEVKGFGAGTSGETAMYFRTSYTTTTRDVDRMIINHLGQVGIGTATPAANLHIYEATTDTPLQITRAANTGNGMIKFETGTTDDWIVGLRNDSTSDFRFYSYGTSSDALTIKRADGKVGIGTTAPGAFLDVVGSEGSQWAASLRNTSSQSWGALIQGGADKDDYSLLVRDKDANDIFTIKGNGYVGIGNNTPNNSQHVADRVQLAIGNTAQIGGRKTGTPSWFNISHGTYFDGTNWKYSSAADEATMVEGYNGGLYARMAVAGTNAGDNISWVTALTVLNTGYVHMDGASQVRLTLGSQGTAGSNDCNWIRGNATNLQFNSAGGIHSWEVLGTERMRLDASGNLGIGDTTPTYKLDVNGTLRATGAANLDSTLTVGGNISINAAQAYFYLNNVGTGNSGLYVAGLSSRMRFHVPASNYYEWEIGGAHKMRLDANGNLGIGTAAPLELLHVQGTNDASDVSIRIKNLGTSNGTRTDLDFHYSTADRVGGRISCYLDDTSSNSTSMHFLTRVNNSSGERMRIDSAGNVGIGTTAPTKALDVVGEIKCSGTLNVGSLALTTGGVMYIGTLQLRGGASSSAQFGTTQGDLYLSANLQDSNDYDVIITPSGAGETLIRSEVAIWGTAAGQRGFISSDASHNMVLRGGYNNNGGISFETTISGTTASRVVIANDGKVGIGTTAPGVMLDVAGSTGIRARYASSATTKRIDIQAGNTSNLIQYVSNPLTFWNSTTATMTMLQDGNVGIGTNAPAQKLHVNGNIRIDNTTSSYDTLYMAGNAILTKVRSSGQVIIQSGGGNISLRDSGGTDRLFVQNSNGYVGIGTTAPAETLHIDGTARIKPGTTGYFNFEGQGNLSVRMKNSSGNMSIGGTSIIFEDQNSNTARMRMYSTGGFAIGSTYHSTDPGANNVTIEGKVGIGTTGPSRPLSVYRSSAGSVANFLHYTDASNFGGLYIDVSQSTDIVTLNNSGSHGGVATDLQVSGTSIMYLKANGYVGVGTNAPSAILHVYKSTNAFLNGLTLENPNTGSSAMTGLYLNCGGKTLDLRVKNALSGNTGYINSSGTLYTGLLHQGGTCLVAKDGNVGIGTTSPANKLSVHGDANFYKLDNAGEVKLLVGEGTASSGNNIVLVSDTTNNRTRLYNSGTGTNFYIEALGANADMVISSPEDLIFRVSNGGSGWGQGTEALRLNANGTSSFNGSVTLANDKILAIGTTSGNAGKVRLFGDSGTSYYVDWFGITSDRQFKFQGSASSSHYITYFTNAGTGKHRIYANGYVRTSEYFYLNAAATPTTVNSEGKLYAYNNVGAALYYKDGYNTAHALHSASDYRLKENVTNYSNSDACALIKGVNARRFDFISDTVPADQQNDRVGFLAHELQDAGCNFGGVVSGTKDEMMNDSEGNPVPKMQSVDYKALVPVLWSALQDALKRIETLENNQ